MPTDASVYGLQPSSRGRNTAQWPWIAGSLGLVAVGAGAALLGYRLREHGRLICSADNHVIGVPADYDGDWWDDRGRKLYLKARQGMTSNEEIALSIIRQEISGGRWSVKENLAGCLSQFPPHGETHPHNVIFWQDLMEIMAEETAADKRSSLA